MHNNYNNKFKQRRQQQQQYLSNYWPDFDYTLKLGFWDQVITARKTPACFPLLIYPFGFQNINESCPNIKFYFYGHNFYARFLHLFLIVWWCFLAHPLCTENVKIFRLAAICAVVSFSSDQQKTCNYQWNEMHSLNPSTNITRSQVYITLADLQIVALPGNEVPSWFAPTEKN